ncbi:MAG TPA: hypothetical protein VHE35_17745 [Kofleriaceae bacterium]|nr:hypothetical protein [Kofleriaceae bacterium]
MRCARPAFAVVVGTVAAVGAAATAPRAHADRPRADLQLRTPFRPTMTMRAAAAGAGTGTGSTGTGSTGTGASTGTGSTGTGSTGTGGTGAGSATVEPRPAVDDPLRFDSSQLARRRARTLRAGQQPVVRGQLVTGFAIDGASPSSDARTLAGVPIASGAMDADGYRRARAYGFGALYLGGRNLLTPGLNGYLAGQARLIPTIPDYAPVPTVWDQTDSVQVGSAWAEASSVFASPLLHPLEIRAGRQYVYGPYTAHLDGVHVRWHRGWFDASVYAGSRVPDWSARTGAPRFVEPQRGAITGAEVALDLRRTAVPVTVRVRALAYEDHGHADLTIDTRLRRALDLTAVARTYDGAVAHEQVTVRYRLSDRTRLVIDGTYRHRRDPLWDFAYRDVGDPGAADRFLDLGPRLPRATLRVRAGTVLLDNVDLLLSGAGALDATSDPADTSLYAAGWLEGGGALEVRMRRTFALGLSGLVRGYNRTDPPPAEVVVDVEDQAGPLALDPSYVGERSLVEGGVSARFSGGARKFSVSAEIYARRTRYGEQYRDDGVPGDDLEAQDLLDTVDLRGGGRVTLDGWVTERVRLRGEYDLSTQLDAAPEIRGLKSLRIVAEGTL